MASFSDDSIRLRRFASLCEKIVKRKKKEGRLGGSASEASDLAQVMISQFVSSSSVSGSLLTAQSLEPASDSGSPSLPLPDSHSISLSLKK